MRYQTIKLSILAIFIGFIAGCSDDSTSPGAGNGTLAMSTELASSGTVKSTTFSRKSSPSAIFVDSLKVTSTAVVVSNLKMHHDDDDSTSSDSTHDGTIKTGPFLLVFDSTGSHVAVSSAIPAGTYDRIKFEIHKLKGKNDSLNAQFADFILNDATIRISGHMWQGGVQSDFTYFSDITENIQVFFAPSVSIEEGNTTNVTLQFVPQTVFFVSGNVLNPLDLTNKNLIKAALKASFKAMKK